jgi:glycosyltransferase involved in cell wall biosynthesis
MKLDNVHFVPPLSKNQMPEALASADACIAILKPVPLYATVFPNKVFDYMAAGKPVILAIDGVIRAVIEQAGAGAFVQPGDANALANAIRDMASNPAEGIRMGEAGRQYLLAHFDRAALARQMQQTVEDLAARPK